MNALNRAHIQADRLNSSRISRSRRDTMGAISSKFIFVDNTPLSVTIVNPGNWVHREEDPKTLPPLTVRRGKRTKSD
jgi:hypothetical protein